MNLGDAFDRFGYHLDDPVPRDDNGQRVIPERLIRHLAATPIIPENSPLLKEESARPAPGELSRAELDVLRWLSQGLHEPDIAHARVVSRETVKTQTASIRAKLAAKTNAHAVAIGLRQGLIT